METNYAGFFRRLFAYAVDYIYIWILLNILGLYVGVLSRFLKLPTENIIQYIALIPTFLINYIFYVLYSTIFLSVISTTPGKYLLKLKVIKENNTKLDFPTSLIRSLFQPLSMILFGIGYTTMMKDPKKQAWHDKIAHTTVIKTSEWINVVKTILIYILVPLGLFLLLITTILIKNNI